MKNHISQEDIERYRQGNLSITELLAIDDHIASCRTCRLRGGNGQIKKVYQTWRKFLHPKTTLLTHLTYEQLCLYVDGKLTVIDRKMIDAHLETCVRCKEELQDLTEFKTTMAAYPAKKYTPAVYRAQTKFSKIRLDKKQL